MNIKKLLPLALTLLCASPICADEQSQQEQTEIQTIIEGVCSPTCTYNGHQYRYKCLDFFSDPGYVIITRKYNMFCDYVVTIVIDKQNKFQPYAVSGKIANKTTKLGGIILAAGLVGYFYTQGISTSQANLSN